MSAAPHGRSFPAARMQGADGVALVYGWSSAGWTISAELDGAVGCTPSVAISGARIAMFCNGILRLFFTFKGSLFWEMQAGMGDVVFAPTYEVLKARGLKPYPAPMGVRINEKAMHLSSCIRCLL